MLNQLEMAALLQQSWVHVSAQPDVVAAGFYARLFELAPDLRQLFPGSIEKQGRKLMKAIGTVLAAPGQFEAMAPVLRDMGRRHVGYGVQGEHYPIVARAMLDTLAHAGASDRQLTAWAQALTVIAEMMIAGAGSAPSPIMAPADRAGASADR